MTSSKNILFTIIFVPLINYSGLYILLTECPFILDTGSRSSVNHQAVTRQAKLIMVRLDESGKTGLRAFLYTVGLQYFWACLTFWVFPRSLTLNSQPFWVDTLQGFANGAGLHTRVTQSFPLYCSDRNATILNSLSYHSRMIPRLCLGSLRASRWFCNNAYCEFRRHCVWLYKLKEVLMTNLDFSRFGARIQTVFLQ